MPDRRLAAIMFTDIVGYTSLMGKDEDRAFQILRKNRDIQRPIIKKYRGEWLKEMGDGILASFPTSSDAVRCAGEIQNAAKEQKILLRIGIHEGEVVFEGGDVLGDGVNVASRLEELAEEGSINISGAVYKDIKNKSGIEVEFVEEKHLKNVEDPIKIYRVNYTENIEKAHEGRPSIVNKKNLKYALGTIVTILLVILIWQFLPFRDKNTPLIEATDDMADKSIAVLPFENISNDPDQAYFCEGMMEAILMHLYKIGDLEVRSKTSVDQYQESRPTIPVIADSLKVSHILEGSVQKSGNQVRITVQLIDSKDRHIWAETYDRDLADVFGIQSEVAQKVASMLKAAISPQVIERIEALPTEDLEAYDYFLKGNEKYWLNWRSFDTVDINQSIDFYKKAIELDPDFSEAYTGLGRSYWKLAQALDPSTWPDYWNKSKECQLKAISIDPYNGWAYAELAVVQYNWEWDSVTARVNLDLAIKLMPNDFNGYLHYYFLGAFSGNCGMISRIKALMKDRFPDTDNPYALNNLILLNCQRDYQTITEIYKEHKAEISGVNGLMICMFGLLEMQLFESAQELLEERFVNVSWFYLYGKAMIHAYEGDESGANQILDSLIHDSNVRYIPYTWRASLHAVLGNKEIMYEDLEKAIAFREASSVMLINYTPVFDPYKNETQFRELESRIWNLKEE